MFVSQPITFPIIAVMCAYLSSTVRACGAIPSVQHTFYGFPDNDPPGPATAFNCGGRNFVAGGSGTFSDPLTMATAPNEFFQCETLYVPYLKKYVRFEDTCAQCTEDFKSGKRHIDIWTVSPNINGGQNQINCEDQLTPDGNGEHTIIRFSAGNLAVDATALYDPSSSSCRTDHVYKDFNVGDACSTASLKLADSDFQNVMGHRELRSVEV